MVCRGKNNDKQEDKIPIFINLSTMFSKIVTNIEFEVSI